LIVAAKIFASALELPSARLCERIMAAKRKIPRAKWSCQENYSASECEPRRERLVSEFELPSEKFGQFNLHPLFDYAATIS
jgi:hypothetical protein